jgi:hypothetical protein
MLKIKERVNGAIRFGCIGRPYAHGHAEDDASDENATINYSLNRDVLSKFFYRAELFHRTLLGCLIANGYYHFICDCSCTASSTKFDGDRSESSQ